VKLDPATQRGLTDAHAALADTDHGQVAAAAHLARVLFLDSEDLGDLAHVEQPLAAGRVREGRCCRLTEPHPGGGLSCLDLAEERGELLAVDGGDVPLELSEEEAGVHRSGGRRPALVEDIGSG
jgi:hypothetical protein